MSYRFQAHTTAEPIVTRTQTAQNAMTAYTTLFPYIFAFDSEKELNGYILFLVAIC